MADFMKAYGVDLRERVFNYIDSGYTQEEAAKFFNINRRTIVRWKNLRKNTGSLTPIPNKRSPHKLHSADVLEYIKVNPDKYLHEIAEHFSCAASSVYYALKRFNVTYKKKLRCTPSVAKKSDRNS